MKEKCPCHCHSEKDLPPGVQCKCIKLCPHCRPEYFKDPLLDIQPDSLYKEESLKHFWFVDGFSEGYKRQHLCHKFGNEDCPLPDDKEMKAVEGEV